MYLTVEKINQFSQLPIVPQIAKILHISEADVRKKLNDNALDESLLNQALTDLFAKGGKFYKCQHLFPNYAIPIV